MVENWNALVEVLAGPAGRALVADLADLAPDAAAAPARQKELRRRHGDAAVRLALRLAEARRRTAARFPDPDLLLFTPELLEQATAHPVAARRASRLAPLGTVLDLGCGAGGDLTRFGLAGATVAGLERDPLAAALAGANLTALGLEGEVVVGECPGAVLPPHDVLFVDPARRVGPRGPAGQRRLIHARDLSPAPADLRPLLATARAWAVKWGPGFDLSAAAMSGPGALLEGLPAGAWSLEVVSWNGSVREAAFYGGAAAAAGPVAAVLAGPADDTAVWTWQGDADAPPPPVRAPGDWIHEPDGALLRAGLMNDYARANDLGLLAGGIAYLTGDEPAGDPGLRSWRRLETLPWSRRGVGEALARHGAGTLTVKTRGVPFDVDDIRRSLRPTGDREVVLVVHHGDPGPVAHLCEPLHPTRENP